MQRTHNLDRRVLDKPRAINAQFVLSNGKTFDLNSQGLIQITFDRYLGVESDLTKQILQQVDITMFDKGGNDLSAVVQQEGGKLRFRYGFDDDLSQIYNLNILKMNSTMTDSGSAIALGAIGQQSTGMMFPEEVYPTGTNIRDILNVMVIRNNWQSDIDVDLKLPLPLIKTSQETDFDFIRTKLLPLANRSLATLEDIAYSNTKYWDVRLFVQGKAVILYFRPKNYRGINRRVWDYSYGMGTDSMIINFKRSISMSHLIQGLNIQVSANMMELSLLQDPETAQEYIQTVITSLEKEIIEIHNKYNIPMLSLDNYKFNVEITDEEIGSDNLETTLKQRVMEAIDRAVSIINTVDIEVIGNHEIIPSDLIKLTVKNKDGSYDYLTTPAGTSTFWRVLKITEVIGLSGFTTRLKLVKEILN